MVKVCALGGLFGAGSGCGISPCDLLYGPPSDAIIIPDRYQLTRSPGEAAQAFLRVVIVTGGSPASYQWSVTDPLGQPADDLLDSLHGSTARFTGGRVDGPYEVYCTATDACGRRRTDRLVLQVGPDLGLASGVQRSGVIARGGSRGRTTIHLNPRLDTPPFDVKWTCTGPDGNIDNDRLDTTDPLMPVFTSGNAIGMYVLTAQITDTGGSSSVESVIVVVRTTAGLEVMADRASVAPGGGSQGLLTLTATPIGGQRPYEFDWEIIGPNSEPRTELLWDSKAIAPVFESADDAGVLVVRCAATDALGTVLIGSTAIEVTPQVSLDIRADRLALPADAGPAGAASLTAEVRGGREPISFDWQVVGPGGQDDSALLMPLEVTEAVFTPDGRTGSYVVRCTATDADGLLAIDSLVLTVGGSLGLTLAADKISLAVGGPAQISTSQIRTQVYGGLPPYSYRWLVIDPVGRELPQLLNLLSVPNPTFLGTSKGGPHSVVCMVGDAAGALAVGQVRINVGQPLNSNAGVDRPLIMAGGGVSGQAQMLSQVNGGSPPYAYHWQVTDPNGLAEPSRLTSSSIAQPVFTSATTTETYRVTLTVADALEAVFVDTVQLIVGSPGGWPPGGNLSIDVSVDRQMVSPLGSTASLAVTTIGGVGSLAYEWTVTAPDGGIDSLRVNPTDEQTATFTSGSAQGTYRVRCTVTDVVGNSFTDSVQLTVSDDFNLDVRADVTHVAPGGPVELLSDRSGGKPNFTYTWSAVDDTGTTGGSFTTGMDGPGSAVQVAADDAVNVWTAPASESGIAGTYRITVVAVDAAGGSFTDSVIVNVTNAFLIDVTTSAAHLVPGASVNLSVNRTGGTPNFTYTWSGVNGSGAPAGTFTTGSTGTGGASQVASDDATNVWTAPPAGSGVFGTYRITVAAMDEAGSSFTDTVEVLVTEPFSINLATGRPVIAPGSSTTIVADRSGGEPTFTYLWTARDLSGASAGSFTAGSTGVGSATQAGLPDDATNTWIAPSIAPGTQETYTITCLAADVFGDTFTDSAQFVVGTDVALALDLVATAVFVAPGNPISLRAKPTGGTPNFDYAWSAVNAAGGAAGTLGQVNQTAIAGDTTNTWTAPVAGAGTLGTYRIEVTVTDAAGAAFTDSVHVVVQSPLSLNVTANDTFVAPSAVVTLAADQTGGETTYNYTWLARDSAGNNAGTFTTGATGTGTAVQAGQSNDASNGWSGTTQGTYTVTCSVTDNTGQTFSDSVSIVITSQDVFSLNVTADRLVLAPGETVNLVADRTAGTATFNYAWTVLNQANTAAGTLGATAQNGLAGDANNTWTAPTGVGVEGSYRITSTVTDALGRTFTDGLIVEISTLALQNIFISPATADLVSVRVAVDLVNGAEGADPGQQILAGFINPVHPRNVVVQISNVNNTITGGTARITGLDARGLPQSEVITIAASLGAGFSTNVGSAPFAAVTSVDLFNFVGVDVPLDQVSLGMGNKFGLTGHLDAVGDVLYVSEAGTVLTAGYTVDVTAGQQGITFASAANGANTYVVVFRAR